MVWFVWKLMADERLAGACTAQVSRLSPESVELLEPGHFTQTKEIAKVERVALSPPNGPTPKL